MKSGAVLLLCAAAAAAVATAQDAAPEFPPGPGRDVAVRLCVNAACHPARTVVAYRHSRAEWRAVISLMRYKGVKWTDEEGRAALEYFHGAFGRINVNIGTKEDLVAVLGVSERAAAEIVKYRGKHGPFRTLTDLLKVRGLTGAMLQPVAERMLFSGP